MQLHIDDTGPSHNACQLLQLDESSPLAQSFTISTVGPCAAELSGRVIITGETARSILNTLTVSAKRSLDSGRSVLAKSSPGSCSGLLLMQHAGVWHHRLCAYLPELNTYVRSLVQIDGLPLNEALSRVLGQLMELAKEYRAEIDRIVTPKFLIEAARFGLVFSLSHGSNYLKKGGWPVFRSQSFNSRLSDELIKRIITAESMTLSEPVRPEHILHGTRPFPFRKTLQGDFLKKHASLWGEV